MNGHWAEIDEDRRRKEKRGLPRRAVSEAAEEERICKQQRAMCRPREYGVWSIVFTTRKLEKECCDSRQLRKRHGPRRGSLLRRRLDEIRAAESLADLRKLPQARCHELLYGNRKGRLSVDLEHPYRLLFRPAHDPLPVKEDGGLDWEKVTVVEILGVEDTHG